MEKYHWSYSEPINFFFSLKYLLLTHHLSKSSIKMTSTAPVKAGYWYCKGKLPPEDIDSNLFTHLFAAFVDVVIDTSTNTSKLNFPEGSDDKLKSFAKTVKIKNPKVKALLSIGGASTCRSIFSKIASQPTTRQQFIATSIEVAKSWHYDGLCLNLQYTNTRDLEEMTNLPALLEDWRTAVDKEVPDPLLLTAAVFYSPEHYPIHAIKNCLDWINVVAYDLKTPVKTTLDPITAPPAPLHNPIISTDRIISVGVVVDAWIDAGVPANKLVLGLPFHGFGWHLKNADNHEISSPANQPTASEEMDPVLYRDIQEIIKDECGKEVIDHYYVTQYCYVGTTWIGYDGKDIIFYKVIYAKQKKLLGYFAWHLDGDDSDWALSKQGNYFIIIIIYINFCMFWISTLSNLIFTLNIYIVTAFQAWNK